MGKEQDSSPLYLLADLSASNGCVHRPKFTARASFGFDGDKSPPKSGDGRVAALQRRKA